MSQEFALLRGLQPNRRHPFDYVSRSNARPVLEAIYELDGDTLKMAVAAGRAAERKRPSRLAPCPKDSPTKWTYQVYKRSSPEGNRKTRRGAPRVGPGA
jgi:hypothetical protein